MGKRAIVPLVLHSLGVEGQVIEYAGITAATAVNMHLPALIGKARLCEWSDSCRAQARVCVEGCWYCEDHAHYFEQVSSTSAKVRRTLMEATLPQIF